MEVILVLCECIMYINGLVFKLCWEWWKCDSSLWQQGTDAKRGEVMGQGHAQSLRQKLLCPSLSLNYCFPFWLSYSFLLWWELKLSQHFPGSILKCLWHISNVMDRQTVRQIHMCTNTHVCTELKLHAGFQRHPYSSARHFLWAIWRQCQATDTKLEDEFLAPP